MPVSGNIQWDGAGFGEMNLPAVFPLFRQVDMYLSSRIGLPPFSSKSVIIIHGNGRPMCCQLEEHLHCIVLATENNDWCRLIFQFAHEYCHHLIDCGLSGITAGLKWFEESICHVSSVANIVNMAGVCANASNPCLRYFTPSVISYLPKLKGLNYNETIQGCLPDEENPFRIIPIPKSEYVDIRQFLSDENALLSTTYSDGHYYFVCRALYPHFHNNPNLWKIIRHLGDTTTWNSLPDLFEHLKANADSSYKDSLDIMFSYLI